MLASLGPQVDDVVLATDAHLVIMCDVPEAEVRRWFRRCDFPAWGHPASLGWLAERTGRELGTSDILFVAEHLDEEGMVLLPAAPDHPRLAEGLHTRPGVRSWRTADGTGMVAVGRGLAGRWELAYEVEARVRGGGHGRGLARAGRALVPPGEVIWAQTPAGNVASVRALLGAGYVPVAGEVLLRPRRTAR